MEEKKIHVLLAYPNNIDDKRITKSVEICKKFPWIEFYCLPHDESYQKLHDLPDKELYEVAILPNQVSGILENIFPYFPNLSWVQAVGTGVEKILTCPNFKENKKIVLTNLKSASDPFLSEFAIFGCLYFAKNAGFFHDLKQEKKWCPKDYFSIECIENKIVLIVGVGSIGTEIARKCKYGFNMKVYGIKRDISKKPDYVDEIYELDNLKDIVSKADFVINCLPNLSNIGKIYTEDIFKCMKKSAVFINVGRGVIVDEPSLCKALKENWIRGAALDVCEKEPIDSSHPFYSDSQVKEKVFLTCHSIDRGPLYIEKAGQILEENLLNYKEGKSLSGIVNKELGY